MPPSIQNLYHGASDTCSNCGGYLHGNGSKLPPSKGGKPRYLCQRCTGLKEQGELSAQDPYVAEAVEETTELLRMALRTPLFESLKWGSRQVETPMHGGFLNQAHSNISQAIECLKQLPKTEK